MKIFFAGILTTLAVFAILGVVGQKVMSAEKTIEHCVTTCQ